MVRSVLRERIAPAAAAQTGTEGLLITTAGAVIGAGIFSAFFDELERTQRQPQLAHFLVVRSLRAFTAASEPRPGARRLVRAGPSDRTQLIGAAAAELSLQLGTFHQRHAAHFHRAPNHPARITPFIERNVRGTGLAFLGHGLFYRAWHFS